MPPGGSLELNGVPSSSGLRSQSLESHAVTGKAEVPGDLETKNLELDLEAELRYF
jgi:hypothetical protein